MNPQIKLNKFIAAIQNWKKINSGKSKILREYDGECFGDALEIILDLSISDGEGCGEEAGPGENWFGGEFTWADICEAGQNNEDLIDSNGQVWEMEFLFAILTEFQDGSNLCSCVEENPAECNFNDTEPDPIFGCMDVTATNFDPTATTSDESCVYADDDWEVDCTKVTPEYMGLYNYNKFCGNLSPNWQGKTGLCSDPEFIAEWPSTGIDLGSLGIYYKHQCECCIDKDTDKDKDDYYKNNYSAIGFVKSVKQQLIKNGKLSEKQMQGLNKVYKRYNKRSSNEIDKKDSGKKNNRKKTG